MKRLIALIPTGLAVALLATALLTAPSAPASSADAVTSLRGPLALEAQKAPPPVFKLKIDLKQYARNFKTQPPLVPHKVTKYKINMAANRCLDCHGKANYVKEESPKIGVSHYQNKDGKEGQKINASRYFCTQCHVAQVDAKPLIANTFVGTKFSLGTN